MPCVFPVLSIKMLALLPQILTPAAVLSEIERIPDPPQRKASLSTTAKEQAQ